MLVRWFGAAPLLAATLSFVTASCTVEPTEVVVTLDSDFPIAATMVIETQVLRGSRMSTGPSEIQPTLWTRGGPLPSITLPASFAVVPGNDPRDETVTLVVQVVASGGDMGGTRSMRRTARFAFTPHRRLTLPIFLPYACTNSASGCMSVGLNDCTVSVRCEEQGLTCGNDGTCVSTMAMPAPDGGVVPPPDAIDGDGSTMLDVPAEGSDAFDGPGCARDRLACGASCVDIANDVDHCGGCGHACPDVPNGLPQCTAGQCSVVCLAGFEPVPGAARCDLPLVRPLAPWSLALVTTRRPTLRWSLPAGILGAHLEICSDRACVHSIESRDVTGDHAQPAADLPPGAVFWRLHSMASGISSTRASATWEFVVPAASRPAGSATGVLPDVDGDGRADLVVGEPHADAFVGQVRVFTDPLHSATSSLVPGSTVSALPSFGASIAVGDFDGDGFGDIAVTSNPSGSSNSPVAVYRGGPTAPTIPSQVFSYPDGIDAGGAFNYTQIETPRLVSLGDVNGDGYDDMAGVNTLAFPSRVVLFSGSPSGLLPLPIAAFIPPDGSHPQSIAGPGDVDGDGFADVVAGCFGMAHAAFVLRGSTTGFAAPQMLSLSAGAGGQLLAFAAGDVNGDGFADAAVGIPTYSGGPPGSVAVLLGGTMGLGTVSVRTSTTSDTLFGTVVGSLGDANHDGFDDVGMLSSGVSGSQVLVFAGGTAGLGTTPAVTINAPGTAAGFGTALASLGDLDGDGIDDFAVGAPGDRRAMPIGAGSVLVYLGVVTLPTTPSTTIPGSDGDGALFGWSIGSTR